jgi:hypothetical protein
VQDDRAARRRRRQRDDGRPVHVDQVQLSRSPATHEELAAVAGAAERAADLIAR